jgi:hypothetical protein
MALRIKTLLYDEGYTIPGARQLLKSEVRQKEPQLALGIEAISGKAELQKLRRLRKEMQDLLNLLTDPAAKQKSTPVQQIRAIRQRPPVIEAQPDSDPNTLFDQLF